MHVLHVRGSVLDEHFSLSNIAAQCDHGVRWTERRRQHAEKMKFLKPLAVDHIRLATRHVLDVARVDQNDLEATTFEDLEEWNPIDAGRFHRHGCDPTRRKPVRQREQIFGERREVTDRLRITVGRHCDIVNAGADIDAGSIRVQAARRSGRTGTVMRLHTCLLAFKIAQPRSGASQRNILLIGIRSRSRAAFTTVDCDRAPGSR